MLTSPSKQNEALGVISAIKLSCDPQAINDSPLKMAMAYQILGHQAGKNMSDSSTLVMSRGVIHGDLCYKRNCLWLLRNPCGAVHQTL